VSRAVRARSDFGNRSGGLFEPPVTQTPTPDRHFVPDHGSWGDNDQGSPPAPRVSDAKHRHGPALAVAPRRGFSRRLPSGPAEAPARCTSARANRQRGCWLTARQLVYQRCASRSPSPTSVRMAELFPSPPARAANSVEARARGAHVSPRRRASNEIEELVGRKPTWARRRNKVRAGLSERCDNHAHSNSPQFPLSARSIPADDIQPVVDLPDPTAPDDRNRLTLVDARASA